MSGKANICASVDPTVKKQAEEILGQLGISMSNAIDMFLRQIVMQNGIPFDMKMPFRRPPAAGELTKEQFDAEIRQGFDDVGSGRIYAAAEVEAQMKSMFGV